MAVSDPGDTTVAAPEVTPTGDLDALLAPDRWSTRRRNPDLRKAVATVQAQIAETRRLLRLPHERTPMRTPAAIKELRSLLEAIDPGDLTASSAWELGAAIRRLNLRLGDVDFVWSCLEYEARRDKLEGRPHRWSDRFSTEELAELLAARKEGDVSQAVFAQAVNRLTYLYLVREEAARESHARSAVKVQYLTRLGAAIAVVLLIVGVSVVGTHTELWKTALVVLLVGLVASPGLVAPWVMEIRDQVTTLDDLRDLGPRAFSFVMLGLGMALTIAAGFAATRVAAGQLEEEHRNSAALAVGASALMLTAWVVERTGFWRRWIFWRRRPDEHVWSAVFASVIALAALTELFAIITVTVSSYGGLKAGVSGPLRLGNVEHYYAWNLADAVPALDVTKTMNWSRPLTFSDHGAGLLLLTYKLLVICPLPGWLPTS